MRRRGAREATVVGTCVGARARWLVQTLRSRGNRDDRRERRLVAGTKKRPVCRPATRPRRGSAVSPASIDGPPIGERSLAEKRRRRSRARAPRWPLAARAPVVRTRPGPVRALRPPRPPRDARAPRASRRLGALMPRAVVRRLHFSLRPAAPGRAPFRSPRARDGAGRLPADGALRVRQERQRAEIVGVVPLLDAPAVRRPGPGPGHVPEPIRLCGDVRAAHSQRLRLRRRIQPLPAQVPAHARSSRPRRSSSGAPGARRRRAGHGGEIASQMSAQIRFEQARAKRGTPDPTASPRRRPRQTCNDFRALAAYFGHGAWDLAPRGGSKPRARDAVLPEDAPEPAHDPSAEDRDVPLVTASRRRRASGGVDVESASPCSARTRARPDPRAPRGTAASRAPRTPSTAPPSTSEPPRTPSRRRRRRPLSSSRSSSPRGRTPPTTRSLRRRPRRERAPRRRRRPATLEWPSKDPAELERAWRRMEALVMSGKVRAIGLANASVPTVETSSLRVVRRRPRTIEVETHPRWRSGSSSLMCARRWLRRAIVPWRHELAPTRTPETARGGGDGGQGGRGEDAMARSPAARLDALRRSAREGRKGLRRPTRGWPRPSRGRGDAHLRLMNRRAPRRPR